MVTARRWITLKLTIVITRTSDVAANIGTSPSFGLKTRIEIVEMNRTEITVNSVRDMLFCSKEKLRFSEGKMVSHRMEIRMECSNITKVSEEKVGGALKTP